MIIVFWKFQQINVNNITFCFATYTTIPMFLSLLISWHNMYKQPDSDLHKYFPLTVPFYIFMCDQTFSCISTVRRIIILSDFPVNSTICFELQQGCYSRHWLSPIPLTIIHMHIPFFSDHTLHSSGGFQKAEINSTTKNPLYMIQRINQCELFQFFWNLLEYTLAIQFVFT